MLLAYAGSGLHIIIYRWECETVVWLQGRLCSSLHITEGLPYSGLPQLLDTVLALCEAASAENGDKTGRTKQDTTVSTLLLLALFFGTFILLIIYPLPD